MKLLIYLSFLLVLACTANQSQQKDNSFLKQDRKKVMKDVGTDTLQLKVQEIVFLKGEADKKLLVQDSLAAEMLLDKALDQMSEFTQDEIDELSNDSTYYLLSQSVRQLKDKISSDEVDDDALLLEREDSEAETIRKQILALDEADEKDIPFIKNDEEALIDRAHYEIPMTMNKKVKRTITFFTTKARRTFQAWLERGHQYEDRVRKIFREEGVPEDLYYLGMIESGYRTRARSWASAVGPWQFIKATGRHYGLKSSYWADDRQDLENATRAAAKHLKDLYKSFGDWYLAMAGYNCNPARIARQVRRQKTKDYFKLKHIPRETRGYVPNFLATMHIAKNLEKYGFKEPSSEVIDYDRIYIKEALDLNHIAKAAKTDYKRIRELNPAIRKWLTPSDRDSMYINVPLGTSTQVLNYIKTIPEKKKRKYIRYRIKNGDAMSLISRKFGISMREIRRINKKRSNSLRAGRYLLIPVPASKYHFARAKLPKKRRYRSNKPRKAHKKASTKGLVKRIYTVKSGDTLGEIAEIYGTKAQNIRDWNGMRFRQGLRLNQKLAIWVPKGFKEITNWQAQYQPNFSKFDYHKVRYGDSLWDIAKKYSISIEDLKKLNNLATNSIKVGSYLKLRVK